MLMKKQSSIWIGVVVFVLLTFYSSFTLATIFNFESYLVDGLTYEEYEKGLNLSISQRNANFRALDYIDTTLLPPLETSKLLAEDIRGAVTFIQDLNNFNAYHIQEQWGVSMDYVASIANSKAAIQADLVSKIRDLNRVKSMINVAMGYTNNSISSIQSKMVSVPFSTSLDYTPLDSSLLDLEQLPLRRFLSDGSATYSPSETFVKQVRNHISGGEYHFMMILPNGKVYTTGSDSNSVGALGRTSGSQIKYNISISLPPTSKVYQLETNFRSNIILTGDGVYTFGSNTYGQLGTGKTINSLSPTKVNGFMGKKVAQIAAGSESMYAITTDGELWSWGSNSRGQLGDATQEDKYRPFKVYKTSGPLNNKKVYKVCAGDSFALALTTDNFLISFGDNTAGQLGVGLTTPDFKDRPVQIPQTGVLSGKNISDIHCGSRHAVVLTSDGKLITWGYNGYGQLGDNSVATKTVPQLLSISGCDVKRVYTKFHSTIVICTNNKMYGFGRNSNGEIGLGASGFLQVPTLYSLTTEFVDSILDISSCSAGSSALLLRDGSVYYSGSVFSTTFFRSVTTASTSYTKDSMYTFMYLPWHLRQSPFFSINTASYLFKSSKSIYSRHGHEFKYYKSSNPDDMNASWKEVTATGLNENSVYNTHYIRTKEYMYFMGGFINNEVTNSIYRAPISDPLFGWQLMNQTLPFPLASGMVLTYSGYVYIVGGIKQTFLFNSTRDVDPIEQLILSQAVIRSKLDSDMRDWEIMYNNKFPTLLHSAIVYKGMLDAKYYVLGGLKSLASSATNNIYRLNDNFDWELASQLPFNVNSGSAILSQNTDSIVITGVSSLNGTTVVGPYIAKTLKTNFPLSSWSNGLTSTGSLSLCSKYPTICNY